MYAVMLASHCPGLTVAGFLAWLHGLSHGGYALRPRIQVPSLFLSCKTLGLVGGQMSQWPLSGKRDDTRGKPCSSIDI